MPVIFASSLMALPSSLARNSSNAILIGIANALYPTGALYVPVSYLGLCVFCEDVLGERRIDCSF